MFTLNAVSNRSIAFLLMALGTAFPCRTHAAVSAEIVVDGKLFKPTHIAAFRTREPGNAHNFLTYMVLTMQAVNADKIKDSIDPDQSLREDPAAAGDRASLYISPDGTIEVDLDINDDAYSGDAYPAGSPGVAGALTGACSANTATHVACNVKTKKPVKTRDGRTSTFKINFDTDVLARHAGEPLAKDGEDAGKALLALYAAAKGDDLDKILALLVPKAIAKADGASYTLSLPFEHEFHPGDNLNRLTSSLDLLLPHPPKITGGERLAPDHALVEVEGDTNIGRMLYLAEMRKVDGTWRFVKATSAGMVK